MATGSGHFECAARLTLALDFAQVRIARRLHRLIDAQGRERKATLEVATDIEQASGWIHRRATHQRRFGGTGGGQDETPFGPGLTGHGVGHGERTAHRAQGTRERQLAGIFKVGQTRHGNLFRGGQDAQRDGQIQTPGLLGQVGRCQIDGDAPAGELEARVEDGGAHAVLAFLDLGVGQANDVEGRQAVSQMDFHRDFGRLHAGQGATFEEGKRHGMSGDENTDHARGTAQ